MKNGERFSFPTNGKESIQERIKQLVGTRSLRKAAQTWGLPYSTINNYFEKNTMPGLNVVATIAKVENVPLEWLVYGEGEPTEAPQHVSIQPQSPLCHGDNDLVIEFLRRANEDDKQKLINTLCEIGIKGILNRLQQADEVATGQHDRPEREYTREEQEAMLRALPISEKAKNTASLVLALGDDAQKEIFEILEDFKRRIAPEGNADNPTVTPDPSLKQKAG
ncbi:helix-turn-helix domain-containing protein [Salmonella enterica subsp. enterica]